MCCEGFFFLSLLSIIWQHLLVGGVRVRNWALVREVNTHFKCHTYISATEILS